VRNGPGCLFEFPGNGTFQAFRTPDGKYTNVPKEREKRIDMPVVSFPLPEMSPDSPRKAPHGRTDVNVETLGEIQLSQSSDGNPARFREIPRKQVTPLIPRFPLVDLPGEIEDVGVLEMPPHIPAHRHRANEDPFPGDVKGRSELGIGMEIGEKGKRRGNMHHKKHSTSEVRQKLHVFSSSYRYSIRKHGQAVEKEGTGFDLKKYLFPAPLEEEIQARVPKGDFCSHHSETC